MILQANNNPSIAIYIHWPFCASKCPYCDFNSHTFDQIDYKSWEKAYVLEIENLCYLFENKKITSLFFGGGTPSLMPGSIVEKVIKTLAKYGKIEKDTEITLEANPNSVDSSRFIDFKTAGINRISIGIQSFNDSDLKFLGRKHSSAEALKALHIAQTHFDNFSFDLIYARENQTLKSWGQELEFALSLAGQHLSLYQLTIEKGTPFYSQYKQKKFSIPNQGLASDLYDLTHSMLKNKGFKRYEISNYSKEGFESKHNLNYWLYGDYLGIGPGAHSRLSFFDNDTSLYKMQAAEMVYRPDSWLNQTLTKLNGIRNVEVLTSHDTIKEIIMMGLRLTKGMSNYNLNRFNGKPFNQIIDQNFLAKLVESKLLQCNLDTAFLSESGIKLHSKIITELFTYLRL